MVLKSKVKETVFGVDRPAADVDSEPSTWLVSKNVLGERGRIPPKGFFEQRIEMIDNMVRLMMNGRNQAQAAKELSAHYVREDGEPVRSADLLSAYRKYKGYTLQQLKAGASNKTESKRKPKVDPLQGFRNLGNMDVKDFRNLDIFYKLLSKFFADPDMANAKPEGLAKFTQAFILEAVREIEEEMQSRKRKKKLM